MASEDFDVFYRSFDLHDFDRITDSITHHDSIDNRLMKRLGTSLPPTAKDLQDYFEKEGLTLLASRAEYVNLKQEVEHAQLMKSREFSEIEQIIFMNLFVFYSMFFWLVSHQFFENADRSSRETVFVYLYGLGMLIFFVYIPFIAVAGASDADILTYLLLIVLAILFIILFKIFAIFRYTHNTGFFSLLTIFIKTFFWPIFLIPIALRWGVKKLGIIR